MMWKIRQVVCEARRNCGKLSFFPAMSSLQTRNLNQGGKAGDFFTANEDGFWNGIPDPPVQVIWKALITNGPFKTTETLSTAEGTEKNSESSVLSVVPKAGSHDLLPISHSSAARVLIPRIQF
jgi:hypothetical protein